MPSKPINYQTGKIYKIASYQTDKVYIGSTTKQYLSDRLNQHKRDYAKYKNGKRTYVTSFELLDFEDHHIILIEDYPSNNRHQLFSREAYWIKNDENCVNRCIPNRTQKEYYIDNKDKRKEYIENNKEIISEKRKIKYNENKEEMALRNKEYRESNKAKISAQRKQYREANKLKIAETQKEYRLKESTIDKRKETYDCQCGSTLRIADKAQHNKTEKHINFMESQQQES